MESAHSATLAPKLSLDNFPRCFQLLWLRQDTLIDNPALTSMDSDSVYITIFSESEETEETLIAQADDILPISIISKVTLNKLEVEYEQCSHGNVKDSRNKVYAPMGMVKLRWHKVEKAKSYPEDFYVVDIDTSFAILGKNAKRA